MNSLYSGVADFGRVYATIGLIFGLIMGLVFMIVGIYLLTKRKDAGMTMETKYQGWGFILFGILVAVVSWLVWHFTRVSKAFAAAEGVYGGVEMVKGLFNSRY